jgi:ABC-type bacteriocin/lantibiotic exporter with double-glycine peptidase domain
LREAGVEGEDRYALDNLGCSVCFMAIGTCLMLGYGARLALSGQLSVGDLVVFLSYLAKMYKPMRDLSKMTDTVSKAAVGFERVSEILENDSGMRDQPRPSRAKSNLKKSRLGTTRTNGF